MPAVAGNEGVGIITAVGSSVKGLSVNDRVIPWKAGFGKLFILRASRISLMKGSSSLILNGLCDPGTWRSNAVAEESAVQRVSSKLTVEAAATIAVNPCAAYRMLKDFVALKPGGNNFQ